MRQIKVDSWREMVEKAFGRRRRCHVSNSELRSLVVNGVVRQRKQVEPQRQDKGTSNVHWQAQWL